MREFEIQRTKSEAPLIAAFAIFSIVVSIVFYPFILIYSFFVFPIMFFAYIILKKLNLGMFKKHCFLILDDQSIRYCFHLFQMPRILKWEQIEKVNYQLYEVNFKLRGTGDVISFQTSYLMNEEDIEAFKEIVKKNCETM